MGKKARRFAKVKYIVAVIKVVISLLAILAYFYANNVMFLLVPLFLTLLGELLVTVDLFSGEFNNARYYEQINKFSFGKLNSDTGEFLDFLISDGIKKETVKERETVRKILEKITGPEGTYEDRRKLVRAIPNLYKIDKNEAIKLLKQLRYLSGNPMNKDIRRRSIDSALILVEQGEKLGKYYRYARVRKILYPADGNKDDLFCAVSLAEALMYMRESFFWGRSKHIENRIKELEKYISNNNASYCKASSKDTTVEIDEAYDLLKKIKTLSGEERTAAENELNKMLSKKDYATTLFIIRNLRITCPGYPSCVGLGKCGEDPQSLFLINKVYELLGKKNVEDEQIDLIRPVVRHFDCVLNNMSGPADKKVLAEKTMKRFFSNRDYLINRTAFDKFGLLVDRQPDFVSAKMHSILDSVNKKILAKYDEQDALFKTMDKNEKMFFCKSEMDNGIEYDDIKDTESEILLLVAQGKKEDKRYQMMELIKACRELKDFKHEIERAKRTIKK